MGDGMPYHLEKGPLLRIFESRFNRPRPELEDLRNRLHASEQANSSDWVLASTAWQHSAFARSGRESGQQVLENLLTHWFGLTSSGAPPADEPENYWIGYRGDVHKIVVTALRWAVDLALACGSDDKTAAGLEPWPIELFWKCPAPWFEAWVVSRRSGVEGNGLVTVVFVTPSHSGASVAQSPIAHSPTTMPPGASHPVPSWQKDYEQVGHPHPGGVLAPVPAEQRDYAMWVVTHESNDTGDGTAGLSGSAGPRTLFDWEVPQLAVYEGKGEVVIVSPSMAAGGIKHGGEV